MKEIEENENKITISLKKQNYEYKNLIVLNSVKIYKKQFS